MIHHILIVHANHSARNGCFHWKGTITIQLGSVVFPELRHPMRYHFMKMTADSYSVNQSSHHFFVAPASIIHVDHWIICVSWVIIMVLLWEQSRLTLNFILWQVLNCTDTLVITKRQSHFKQFNWISPQSIFQHVQRVKICGSKLWWCRTWNVDS